MPQKVSRNCERLKYHWSRESPSRDGGYACARDRAAKQTHHPARRTYDDASDLAKLFPARRRRKEESEKLAESFREHVERWKNETGHLSSITKAIAHPSYLRIIGLAKESKNYEIERLLLRELESDPDQWFAALSAVTGEDPVKPDHDYDEAVTAWLDWGRKEGII